MRHYKAITVITLVIMLFCLIIQPSFAFEAFYAIVTARRLNVRANPSTKAEVLYQSVKGDEIWIIDAQDTREGRWYYARLNSEQEGWVSGKYIKYKRPDNF